MVPVCPKCASTAARRLPLVHRDGIGPPAGAEAGLGMAAAPGSWREGRQQSAISRRSAPPGKRCWVLWFSLMLPLMAAALATLRDPGLVTLAALALSGVATHLALRALIFNLDRYPGLRQRWERSFMCRRCGEVFGGES